MMGDFNIRDTLWDLSFPFHSSISDDLIMMADSFDLILSSPTNSCSTRYSDIAGESNSTIDLMFFRNGSTELNNHSILPDHCPSSDHAPLLIDTPIFEEIILTSKLTITPKSEQETEFINDIISNFKKLETSNIEDINKLERLVNQLGSITDQAWSKNTKKSKILKHSKQWWSDLCSQTLINYRTSRSHENWKYFKTTVKEAKQTFFDDKIQEIMNKS